jgi:hypothetical protein
LLSRTIGTTVHYMNAYVVPGGILQALSSTIRATSTT